MGLLSNTAVLLQKEIQAEYRSHELLTTATVFILIVIVLFSLRLIRQARNRGNSDRACCGWLSCFPRR